MNEQQLQSYLNLIEQLFSCASEAELHPYLTDSQELLTR